MDLIDKFKTKTDFTDLIDKFKLNDPPCKFRLKKSELIISTLAINFLSLALPIMVLQIYDRVMLNHSFGTLAVLGTGVTIAIIFEGILRIARSYATSWSGMIYEYTMAANAMRYYINANPLKLKKEGAGAQIQNLGAFSNLRDFYGGQALVNLIDIPFALLFIVLISYLTGLLVLVPLILIGVFTCITWVIGNNLKVALQHQDKVDDKRYNFIIDTLQGIHTIKSMGIEAIFKRRYERLEEESTITNYNSSVLSTEGYTFGILFNEIMVICVVIFGAPMVIDKQFTTGALTATILLAGRLMQPIQKTLFLWTQFQDYRIANNKAIEIFSIEQIDRSLTQAQSEAKGEIQIKNLSFGYDQKNILFENINLNLKIPNVIAIYGVNNAGKSTLLKLIAGILPPTKGSITIDGIPAINYSAEEIVKHVGYISSENIVFQGTILQNLTAFDETKEKQAMEIAKLLKLDKDIAGMPKGYETKVYDGIADTIAPGVKQRISIARALLHRPKIILFNNADKGLDREGYNHLIRLLTLLKGKATMIITTDDHNINRLADKEYILENKTLREVTIEDSSVYDIKSYQEFKL